MAAYLHGCFWTCFTLILLQRAFGQTDPCTNYTPLNDSTLLTTYSTQPGDTIPALPTPRGWYRYVTTPDGLISTSCPTGNQCGSDRQVWINGSLPTSPGTIRNSTLCRRQGSNCCQGGNSMEVKYCSTFLVFKMTPLVGARLCFQDTRLMPPNTTKPNSNGSSVITSTPQGITKQRSAVSAGITSTTESRSRASVLSHFGKKIDIIVMSITSILSASRWSRI